MFKVQARSGGPCSGAPRSGARSGGPCSGAPRSGAHSEARLSGAHSEGPLSGAHSEAPHSEAHSKTHSEECALKCEVRAVLDLGSNAGNGQTHCDELKSRDILWPTAASSADQA